MNVIFLYIFILIY